MLFFILVLASTELTYLKHRNKYDNAVKIKSVYIYEFIRSLNRI